MEFFYGTRTIIAVPIIVCIVHLDSGISVVHVRAVVVVVDDVKAGVDDAVRRSDGGSFSNNDDEMEYELN